MGMARKAYAYITREADHASAALVFRHRDDPEAGIQVPRGTVDAGEDPAVTVVREVCEECGQCEARLIGLLARDVVAQPDDPTRNWERFFFHLVAPNAPDEWEHTVTGEGEDNGLVFSFFWLPRERLGDLWPGFGDYLYLILS
jgi:putative (di)nucleoside polyphosphate hydrolase